MTVIASDDVEASLGRTLSDAEILQVDQWIDDAELLIGVRLGDVSLLNQDVLAYVVREAVLARLRNPEGFQSETIDDYTYRLPSETRRITILDDWWQMLSPTAPAGAFTIRPYYDSGRSDLPDWWNDLL